MALKKIKNLRQLALAMPGFEKSPGTVHRIFSGKNSHTTLRTYKRIATIFDWTLEEFFEMATNNQPDAVSFILRAKMKSADISVREFIRYVSDSTTYGGGNLDLLEGKHKFERLSLYRSLSSALGITADTMYESLIMSESLTKRTESEKLSSSDRTHKVNT